MIRFFENHKRIWRALAFYIGYFLLFVILDKAVPAGPCVPGLGFFVIAALPIFITIALFANIWIYAKLDKAAKGPIVLHAIALLGVVIWFLVLIA